MLPWLLFSLALLAAAALLLPLRLRVDLGPGRRRVFLGLGPAGASVDFAREPRRLRILGIPVARLGGREKEDAGKAEREADGGRTAAGTALRGLRRGLRILRAAARPVGRFLGDLRRATVLEELEADLEGGFEDPATTGMAFGWYRAAVGAVPSLAERVRYRPDWRGPSLCARVRASAKVPLYRLAWCVALLAARLPKRRLLREALASRKGD